MDDQAQLDGAASHELRDHFVSWVVHELPRRLHADEAEERDWDVIRRNKGYAQKGDDVILDIPNAYSGYYGARYDFCIFVDICLESLDHMDPPVVKLLRKRLGPFASGKERVHGTSRI